jgi:SsrA-binding protein
MATYLSHKRASFDYEILETFEAGLALLGTEVKSVRSKLGKLEGGHVIVRGNEAYLVGASIPPFQKANAPADYDPERPRKLLLSRKELAKIHTESETKGLTVVPIKLYNKNQKLKLEIAVVRGKKKYDKRESIKARDTKRDVERTLKNM